MSMPPYWRLRWPVAVLALLIIGPAAGCKKTSHGVTGDEAAVPGTRPVSSAGSKKAHPGAPPVSEDPWKEGSNRESRRAEGIAKCEVGKPGCTCLPGFVCIEGVDCFWGYCYGEGFPAPDTYRYTDRARGDYYLLKILILSQLKLEPGMHIADIGAGRGNYSLEIAERVSPGGIVYATDIDPKALQYLSETLARKKKEGKGESRVEIVLVKRPRDTGLSELPGHHLDLVLLINSVSFPMGIQRSGPQKTGQNPAGAEREADLQYLRTLYDKLKPGGRILYHADWIEAGPVHRAENVRTFFHDAGFVDEDQAIPMPEHIPEKTFYMQYNADGTEQRLHLFRGYILVFQKPSG